MTRRARRKHTPAFKAKMALAAIKGGDQTLAEMAQLFDVHPNQITRWKAQFLKGAASVFGSGPASPAAGPPVDSKALHAKVGELALENDRARKRTGRTIGIMSSTAPRSNSCSSRKCSCRVIG